MKKRCPPCRGFTPKFAKVYDKVKAKESNFEVIFQSSDQDQEAFKAYLNEMPWLAIPFDDSKRKAQLSNYFGVAGIPNLVILDSTRKIINENARGMIDRDQEGKYFPWNSATIIPDESSGPAKENCCSVM